MFNMLSRGGPVMYPLLICSWLALTVVLERAVFWMKMRKNKKSIIVNKIKDLNKTNNVHEIEKTISSEEKKMLKGLNILSTIKLDIKLATCWKTVGFHLWVLNLLLLLSN